MNLLKATSLPAFLLCAGMEAGTITAVGSRGALAGNDTVTWGTAADDLSSVASPFTRTSTGGIQVTAALVGGFTIFLQNGAAFAANFTPGDVVLSTFSVAGPVTIAFDTAVRGVGVNIVHENFSPFTGTMQFYGLGNTLFGEVNVNGTSSNASDGSAPFLGGVSDQRDIVSVVVSVGQQLGGAALALNDVSLVTTAAPASGIPEPSTVMLVSAAAVALAWQRTRRQGSSGVQGTAAPPNL